MSNLQASLRISAVQRERTRDVMTLVNSQITRTTAPEKFATFFYGIYDAARAELEYTNAGHNYPILSKRDGGHRLLKDGGMIIGIIGDAAYESETLRMESGDLLVLYTDGLTEAVNAADEEFGEERLVGLVKRIRDLEAQQALDLILEDVVNFTGGQLQRDDLTIVAMKIK